MSVLRIDPSVLVAVLATGIAAVAAVHVMVAHARHSARTRTRRIIESVHAGARGRESGP